MAKHWTRFWTAPLALCWLGAAGVFGPSCPGALAQDSSASATKSSWMDSITSGVKSGFSKLGNALNPKSSASKISAPDDEVSLKSKAKPGPELYVAVAQFYAQSHKFVEAEQQYQLALKTKPDYLPALLGYAQLQEQLEKQDEAIRLYQRAAKLYPREAAVYNNMGLCYARLGRLDQAVGIMAQAVELAPKNPRYRNNIAAMLVDQGRLREAFAHLKEAHGEAAAYYNLGYLLNKRGQTQAAMQHFSQAIRVDPSMTPAQQWLNYLQQSTAARFANHSAAQGAKVVGEQARDDAKCPPPNEENSPRRLPPPPSREPATDEPTLPGIAYRQSAVSTAPLPPKSANTGVQPLPRVN